MQGYGPASYGDHIFELYDALWGKRIDYAQAAAFLARRAASGPALELGVGTGLVALPLAGMGIDVHGVDASDKMLEQLRPRARGTRLTLHVGEFSHLDLGRTFPLVYSTFCSFPMSLLTQQEQLGAFEQVVRHLSPEGRLVIEQRAWPWKRNQVKVRHLDPGRTLLLTSEYDPVTQVLRASHLLIEAGQARVLPYSVRYVSPPELDLMAAGLGLKLESRHGGFGEQPLTPQSTDCVSVYVRPAG